MASQVYMVTSRVYMVTSRVYMVTSRVYMVVLPGKVSPSHWYRNVDFP